MAENKMHQGKQKGKDKFFTSPKKTWNNGRKQNDSNNSAAGNFFIKSTETPKTQHGDRYSKKEKKQNKGDEGETLQKESKKPFDKKKYRLKKYSKKYRVQQWEERRKKAVVREYNREIKGELSKITDEQTSTAFERLLDEVHDDIAEDIHNETNADISESQVQTNMKKKKHFLKPHEEFQRVKEEKKRKQEDFLKKKNDREEARKKALKERIDRSKKLSRKTKKGQPIMKYRMEMLLDKVQKSMNQ